MHPESTVTAVAFLEEQQRLVAEAAEALPHAIDTCSFARGPLTQSVYSCRTCTKDSSTVNRTGTEGKNDAESAAIGVCYACFVQCHTTHDVVELFERRNFTCDCGTRKAIVKCCLQKSSIGEVNELNTYDDTFKGIFCYCKELYDYEKEAVANSVMLQCCLCEDWFHDRCIKNCLPEGEFDEFMCKNCVGTHPFLKYYDSVISESGLNPPSNAFFFVREDENATERDNSDSNAQASDACVSTPVKLKRKSQDSENSQSGSALKRRVLSSQADHQPSSPLASIIPSPHDCEALPCKLSTLISSIPKPSDPPVTHLFCGDGWRDDLCRCSDCMAHYKTVKIDHLLQERKAPSGTPSTPGGTAVLNLLRPDVDASKSLHEIGMEALNRVPRAKAIEGVMAYERLAEFSKQFFRKFAEEGRVVTKNDIDTLFAELKNSGSGSSKKTA
ncbi:hypothetical protein CcCBS67573_g07702 [Chytriomyces confervae]|uniref:UBR-type domain-containing protein n=1 Tax=Chytriomyces confervae TaxID=246404 RepID=A0A507ESF4_9FUNG|nr:hypothetical protein CcCBS67573_g07702 [Chytriomyces confervae]